MTFLLTAGDSQTYIEILSEVEAGPRGILAPSGATAAGIALAKLMAGGYQPASEYFIRALEVFPDAPGLLAMSAQAAFAFKHYDKCFQDASRSVELGWWPGARALAIASAAKTGRVDVAQRLLDEAGAMELPVWMEVAAGFHLMGEQEEAAQAVSRLLDAFPDAVEANWLAGSVEIQRRNWGEAEQRFRFVLDAAPRHNYAAAGLLVALIRSRAWREADGVADQLQKRFPYHALVGLWLALSHARKGRFLRGWKELRSSSHAGALHRDKVDQLGSLILARGRAGEAFASMRIPTEDEG